MIIKRYLEKNIVSDLKDKMVFIAGPRQVGKTTTAKEIGNTSYKDNFSYFNWDNREHRKNLIKGNFKPHHKLAIFDEIHKYKKWKNFIKGIYDTYRDTFSILVTGSTRLDIYRKSGDSLLGRYHHYRLHPFSLKELLKIHPTYSIMKELIFSESSKETKDIFNNLFKFGGFPEIFIDQSDKNLRRWHNERIDRLIKEDIRDITNIRDLSSLQILVELLPDKVGSLFSLNSLREDLEVTHKTMRLWTTILETFYYHFRISCFQNTLIKSLKKEPKIYLWDWSELTNESAKFENIIASHLLKFCHFLKDAEGYKTKLFYLRDIDGHEVDFLVTVNNKPWFCVEAKASFKTIHKHIHYFDSKLKIPFKYQVVREPHIDYINNNIRVISADKFLTSLV